MRATLLSLSIHIPDVAYLWSALVAITHFSAAIAVTLHAVLRKRESQTVAAWVGLAWLAPVVGSFFYLCLGINRITRTGATLDLRKAWEKDLPEPGIGVAAHLIELVERHPGLAGLARAGRAISGRKLTLQNSIDPLIDGDQAYPAMLEAIDRAERSVNMLSYIFDNDRAGDRFFDALVRAHRRGLEVRVLIDYVGSRYSPRPTIVKRLRRAGIRAESFLETRRLWKFRYANLRNHRKILVIDGKVGFTGGTNIREGHWLSLDPKAPVKCLHFRVEGPVVTHMQEAFAVDWAFTTGEQLDGEPWFTTPNLPGNVGARGISDGPDGDLDKMMAVLSSALSVATRHVRIVTPYFLPPEPVTAALTTAAVRGVEIEILLPAQNNIPVVDWATTPNLPFLLDRGCRIYKSPPPFDHSKLLTVDGIWSLIGSTNWDARSLRLNFEYNIECYGDDLARELDAIIDKKIAAATPVTLEDIHSRNTFEKLRDGLARLFSPYL